MFDINSLLLGSAISGLCLAVTMMSFWLSSRGSGFMVTWAASVVVLVGHVIAFWLYAQTLSPMLGTVACALLPLGTIGIYATARQFTDEARPLTTSVWLALPCLAFLPPIFALGYDGLALVLQYAIVAVLFVLTGLTYFRRLSESRVMIGSLGLLYIVMGLSFALCGVVLLVEGQWRLGYPPSNWAEDLNVILAIIVTTSAGALTLSIDQTRLARHHRVEAITDPMTGLYNRRSLTARHAGAFGPRKAVVLFDLDRFKQVNDAYGHAAGDHVIRTFARIANSYSSATNRAVRMGGEEFVIVLEDATPDAARRLAESVVTEFGATLIDIGEGRTLRCTVSAGIAFGDATGPHLEEVLARADRALYAAKRAGRNRVEMGELRLVG